MNKSFEYLPKDKRKKIVVVCDDIRVHSGIATVAKEIVLHTAHHFNWVNVGGAIIFILITYYLGRLSSTKI